MLSCSTNERRNKKFSFLDNLDNTNSFGDNLIKFTNAILRSTLVETEDRQYLLLRPRFSNDNQQEEFSYEHAPSTNAVPFTTNVISNPLKYVISPRVTSMHLLQSKFLDVI